MQINGAAIAVIVGICSIVAFFIGQYTGIKKKGYDEGVKDTAVAMQISNMARTVEKIEKILDENNLGELRVRIKALEIAMFGEAKETKST